MNSRTANGIAADRVRDVVEVTSEDSFPASDPPSWTPFVGLVPRAAAAGGAGRTLQWCGGTTSERCSGAGSTPGGPPGRRRPAGRRPDGGR